MDTLKRKLTPGSDVDASCPDTGPLMSVDQRVRSDVRGPDLWLAAACGSLTLKELIGLKSHGERSSRRFVRLLPARATVEDSLLPWGSQCAALIAVL